MTDFAIKTPDFQIQTHEVDSGGWEKYDQFMEKSLFCAEALQKIGRNVVDFQRMEGMLKVLLGSIEFDSALGDPETQTASWHELVSKKTMGTVSKDLLEKLFSELSIRAEYCVNEQLSS